MSRSTRISAYFSLLRAGSAGAAGLAMILSCSDATSPKGNVGPALKYIEILVPDSIKNALGVPSNGLGTVLVGSSKSVASPVSASLSADVAPAAYLKSRPDFAGMEAAPANRIVLPPAPGGNDGYVPDVPLGFNFSFYGTSYDKLNVFANGLVTFGTPDDAVIRARLGYYSADLIPDAADPNNMIALSWSDWSPSRAGVDAIRYETRGTAPNRRFILQFTNVPEFGSFAFMTVQLVLNEGSNEITIYTPTMSTSRSVDLITQGIENADGTDAAFDSTFHPILLEWYPRVRGFYKLTNDAVRFSPSHVNQPPVVLAPPSIEVTTAPPAISGNLRLAFAASSGVGVCSAVVNPGAATVTDDADGVTTTGVRSDGSLIPLDAAYPKGVTTITWTATDAGGLTSSATQTVTVDDKENPLVGAPADVSARTDRGKNSATVQVGNATPVDNCPNVTVASARSDGAELSAPYPIGLTSIIWTATDESGNTSSASQSIDVHGNLPPVVTAPASFAVNTDARVCNALANIGTATVTDDDVGSTVAGRRSDGGLLNAAYPKGLTTITWTATDADGLTSAATQTLTVGDGEKPSVGAPAGISTGNDRGRASALVAVGNASAEDNCPGVIVNGSRNDAAALDAPYNVGVTTITWTARDAAGNNATATQSISVLDVEAPTLTVPASMRVNATSASGAVVNYAFSSSDNVGVTDVSCKPASGTQFPMGTTNVTCSVSDAAGHTVSKSFSVIVDGAASQRASLIDFVLSRDPALPNGTANPLVNQLRAAANADGNGVACTKMADFIKMVVKKAGDIQPDDASYMILEARSIMGVMECPYEGATATDRIDRSSRTMK